jgi:hypothetical protein
LNEKPLIVFSILALFALAPIAFGTGETISPNMNLVIPGVILRLALTNSWLF